MHVTLVGGTTSVGGIGAAQPSSTSPCTSCCSRSIRLLVGTGGVSVGGSVGGSDAMTSDLMFSCFIWGSKSLGRNWKVVLNSSGGDSHDGPGSS